jgi:hypothetical protein
MDIIRELGIQTVVNEGDIIWQMTHSPIFQR